MRRRLLSIIRSFRGRTLAFSSSPTYTSLGKLNGKIYMKKMILVALLAAVAGCSTFKQQEPPPVFKDTPEVKPLSETVAVLINIVNKDKQIREDEQLVIDLRIINLSQNDAIIYNELEPGWLVVLEFISKDNYTRIEETKASRVGKYHYATLPPGGYIGRQYKIRPNDLRYSLVPGTYSVRFVYRNSYEPCVASPFFTDDDIKSLGVKAVVPLVTGMASSNVETFTVVAVNKPPEEEQEPSAPQAAE